MKKRLYGAAVMLGLLLSHAAAAEDALKVALGEKMKMVDPRAEITNLSASPIRGLYQVELNGKEIVYSNEEGSYILTGDLLHIEDGKTINTTELALEQVRASILAELNMDDVITFSDSNVTEIAEVYVFTDVSCGYCKAFHKNIEDINSRGITVHYLAFPREGLLSPAGQMMQAVWCSSDRQRALTEAKSDGKLSQNTLPCNGPLANHFALAAQLDIHGTPAIYSIAGKRLGGYLSPQQLQDTLISH